MRIDARSAEKPIQIRNLHDFEGPRCAMNGSGRNTMQSVVFHECGEPADVLRVEDRDAQKPQPGEVRVRMLASPVNPSDLMYIRGVYGKKPQLPATPGFEGVGVVEESGGGLLGKLIVGRRVAVLNGETGNWTESTCVPAKQAVPVPAEFSVEQSAMFFVNPATAYIMTQRVLKVPRGAWLLQTAAGSALGRMVIRLGKHFGFRTVNVVRRAEQAEELEGLGADAVIVFDPQQSSADELGEQLERQTGQPGVRFAIDPVGGAVAGSVVTCLGPEGRLLLYGTLSSEPVSFSPRALMTPGNSVEGFWLARYMAEQKLSGKLSIVGNVKKLIRAGVLTAEVGQTFPLAKVTDAVQAAETVGRDGKVLLKIAEG